METLWDAVETTTTSTATTTTEPTHQPMVIGSRPLTIADKLRDAEGRPVRLVVEVQRYVDDRRVSADYERIGTSPDGPIRCWAARQWMHYGTTDAVEVAPWKLAAVIDASPRHQMPLYRERASRLPDGHRVREELRVHLVVRWPAPASSQSQSSSAGK